jgi:serine/threonine protein kinase
MTLLSLHFVLVTFSLFIIGTLLFEMLNGLPPFYDEDVQEMYTKILSAELEIPDFISDEAADLLVKLLDRDPKTRLQQPPQIKVFDVFSFFSFLTPFRLRN